MLRGWSPGTVALAFSVGWLAWMLLLGYLSAFYRNALDGPRCVALPLSDFEAGQRSAGIGRSACTVAMSAWALPFIMPVRPAPALYLEMDRMTDRIHHHEA